MDRVRDWLPLLLALSAASPYWQGEDSGYASFRSQAWGRWPMAGPLDVLGTPERYDALLQRMLDSGVIRDLGMLYADVRLARDYPTVEVRVSDVTPYVDDTVLVAALARGLVETAARQWRAGEPGLATPLPVLRLHRWQAARYGVAGDLIDPRDGRPRPAADVLGALSEHVADAVRDAGDTSLVQDGLARVAERGTADRRMRATYERTGSLAAVALDVAELTVSAG